MLVTSPSNASAGLLVKQIDCLLRDGYSLLQKGSKHHWVHNSLNFALVHSTKAHEDRQKDKTYWSWNTSKHLRKWKYLVKNYEKPSNFILRQGWKKKKATRWANQMRVSVDSCLFYVPICSPVFPRVFPASNPKTLEIDTLGIYLSFMILLSNILHQLYKKHTCIERFLHIHFIVSLLQNYEAALCNLN